MTHTGFLSARMAGCVIFLIAAVLRFVVAYKTDVYRAPSYGETVCVARSINSTGNFADAFCASTGPTAHLAPIYPYFLAFILRLFPSDLQFTAAITAVGVLGSALLWSLLPMAAERMGLGIAAGVLGGSLGAANVLRHYTEFDGQWEAVSAAIALVLLCLLTLRVDLSERAAPALGWGCAWGAGLLLLPSLLPVFLSVLFVLTVRRRCSVRNAALALCCLAAVISPWIVRDYRELGGFVLIRDNLGLELSLSNHEGAQPAARENHQLNSASNHPAVNKGEQAEVRRLGELEYNRRRMQAAVAWIRANRAEFLRLTALRVYHFWVVTRRASLLPFEFAEAAVAWIGLWLIVRARKKSSYLFLICFLVFPLIYYFIQADERYRYPIEWMLILCVAYALTGLMRFAGVPLPAETGHLE